MKEGLTTKESYIITFFVLVIALIFYFFATQIAEIRQEKEWPVIEYEISVGVEETYPDEEYEEHCCLDVYFNESDNSTLIKCYTELSGLFKDAESVEYIDATGHTQEKSLRECVKVLNKYPDIRRRYEK